MTGFLHRLAERATGAAHPLRKVATNLFAPPLLEDVSQTDAILPGRVDPAPALVSQGVATPAQPGPGRKPGVSAESARPDAARHEASVDQPLTDRRPDVSEKARDTAIRQPASEPPPLMPRVAMTVQSAEAVAAANPMSSLPPSDDAHAEPLDVSRPTSSARPRVEPLLPLRQTAVNLAGPTVNASRADSRNAPAGLVEETTEVHVSIGRIEVTAVHEPAPAKPAASRRNAPMSLDDYLAKRHGGRS